MPGIGDYIHARYDNYLFSSNTQYAMAPAPSAQVIYNQQKNTLLAEYGKTFSDDQKAKIENYVNAYFYPGLHVGNVDMSEEMRSVIYQAVVQYLDKNLGEKYIYNSNTLEVNAKNPLYDEDLANETVLEKINGFQQLNGERYRQYKALLARYEALKAMRQDIALNKKMGRSFVAELEALDRAWEELDRRIENFAINSDVSENNIPIDVNRTIMPRISKSGNITSNIKSERLDQKIERLIKQLQVGSGAYASGKFAEAILAASGYMIASGGNAKVKDLVKFLKGPKNKIKTSQYGVLGMNMSWYATYPEDGQRVDEKTYKKLQGDNFHAEVTEDKVDVTWDLDDLGPLNFSVKNYDLSTHNSIRLETGVNLLKYAQEYINFTNHFLNIVPKRIGIVDKNSPSAEDIQIMRNAMKATAFAKALAGNAIVKSGNQIARSDMVDILLVNDKSKGGGYKVYYISELIQKVLNGNERWIKYPAFDQMSFSNTWQGGYYYNREQSAIRISKLVGQLRNLDLVLSISTEALT